MLKQLLSSTNSFTNRCGSTLNKAGAIDGLSRWHQEMDSLPMNEAMNTTLTAFLGKCNDDDK